MNYLIELLHSNTSGFLYHVKFFSLHFGFHFPKYIKTIKVFFFRNTITPFLLWK